MKQEMTKEPYIELFQVSAYSNEVNVENLGILRDKLVDLSTNLGHDANRIRTIPVPLEAPADIERLALPFKNDNGFIRLYPGKIIIQFSDQKPTFEEFSLENHISRIRQITNEFVSGNTISRVGFISAVVIETAIPHQILQKLAPKLDIELNHYQSTINYDLSSDFDQKTNLHIKISGGQKDTNPNEKAIVIQQDINTHQDLKLDWDVSTSLTFIEKASSTSKYCKSIIELLTVQ